LANKVVFLVRNGLSKDVQNYLQRSGRLFLFKPFSADKLISKVTEALMPKKKEGKILIAEDDEETRNFIHVSLSSTGYNCDEASNTDEVLGKLESNPSDLVLLDVKISRKAGLDLISEIQSRYPETAITNIITLSSGTIGIQCRLDGSYYHFNICSQIDELTMIIEWSLEKKRLELEIKECNQLLERKIEETEGKSSSILFNSLEVLVNALEANNKFTIGHSETVMKIAVAIAEKLNLAEETTKNIELAGVIYDIGNIGMEESIITKPEKLNTEEYQKIKSHPTLGEHILNPIVEDKEILKIVRHHHERYDGTGYPDGLKAEQIPLGARILAVSDAYEAMISARPFREAMSFKDACEEMR
jgi:response regulator RpfG family c-di-GMP phosphodiesterase